MILAAVWRCAAAMLAPALRLHLRRRAARGREIAARLPERRGIDPTPRPAGPLLWIHAASVGETLSVLPVLAAMGGRAAVLLTTGTVTSQTLLAQRLLELGLSERVTARFAPLDVPAWVARFLAHWRPEAACFIESEIWPNQLAACRTRGIPVVLINGRMSDRSVRQWRRVPGLARAVLAHFARIEARSAQDAERLRALGAANVTCPGDLKLAAPPLPVDQRELDRLRRELAGRPVWVAASTHPNEEILIAAAHRLAAADHPGLLTIIVPRHPDRGADLAALLRAPRRGAGQPPTADGVWIADTMGELGLWYRLARIVFVGRSLVPPGGGQNPLEPARLGCAIAVGPYCGNFADSIALLRGAGALAQVADAAGIAAFVVAMLDDPERCRAQGQAAADAVRRNAALPDRTAAMLLSLLPAFAASPGLNDAAGARLLVE